MPKLLPQPGRAYSFLYPRHNFHGILSKFEPRRVRVTSVRDLTESPLEQVTFDLQPLLRRGRILVTGIDLDKNAERSFYLSSMRDLTVTETVTTECHLSDSRFAEELQFA